jgi:hypothetical protein
MFRYVEQARNNKTNNRVYALKFTSTPKKVHFFWMQEPASAEEKDKELADKVNAMINGESAGAAYGGMGQMDQAQLMAMLTQAHSSPGSASESPAAPAAGETETSTTTGEAAGAEAGVEGGSSEGDKDDADKMKVDDEAKP